MRGHEPPFARISESFRDVTATELGVIAAKGAINKAGIRAEEIDQVVFGNVQQSSKDAHLLARHVGLKAGTRLEVPAVTINRVCGTGIEAILYGARYILTGEADVVLAGGTREYEPGPPCYSWHEVGQPARSVRLLKTGFGMAFWIRTVGIPWPKRRKIWLRNITCQEKKWISMP